MIREDLTSFKNLNEMIEYGAENFPDVHFIEYKENGGVSSKTYTELKKAVDSFSKALLDSGFKKPHAAIVGVTSFEWIASFFGTAGIGGVNVPLAPNETDEMNLKLMDFADCDILLFIKKNKSLYKLAKEKLPGIKLFISLDNKSDEKDVINFSDFIKGHEGETGISPDPDDVCAIDFTSGTTGFPKGVMCTHKNYVYSAGSVHVACPTLRMFCCLPIHHSFCFTGNITKSIVRGKTVCVNDSFQNLVSDLQLYKPDSILCVPLIAKKLMFGAMKFASAHYEMDYKTAVKAFFGGHIMDMISGGAPLEADLNKKFNDTGILVLNGYGMTECSPIIANNAIGSYRHGSVGKPIPCMKVKIENGEILVKGPSVMKGYYKNEEATKEAFDKDGYLHTGDLGYFDEDGFLYVTGRRKNLILLDNGENVSAEALEDKFGTEKFVKEVVCYGESGSIVAEIYPNSEYVEKHGVTDLNSEAERVVDNVNSKLAQYQRITSYVLRDIPFAKTSSNKLIRSSKLGLTGRRKTIAPSTATEKKVADAVKNTLGLDDVSISDNFFAIGGNSLNAVELALSLNISVQKIYDHPFLNELASSLDVDKDKADNEKIDSNSVIAETKGKGERQKEINTVLLTGATGFLGIHILSELIKRNVKIYCLVRNEEKLLKQAKYYFGGLDMTNVTAVRGDIEKKNLGLSDKTYAKLADEVDAVIHTAANVHHSGDYSDLEKTNVEGTENVISFAEKAGAVLNHTSTVSLHGAGTVKEMRGNRSFDETVLDIGQKYEENVYIHSKYIAEQEVLKARKDGLRANIFRIGNLTWRSSDGKFQKNSDDNGFLHRIRAMIKLGIVTDKPDKYPMDLTAVDECAEAYVSLVFDGDINEIYHLYNPNYLKEEDMFKLLSVNYRKASRQELIQSVLANSDDRDIHVYLFYMIISGRSREVETQNSFTAGKLNSVGFKWSVPDRHYLTLNEGNGTENGLCLDFPEFKPKDSSSVLGKLGSIQKITLGTMQDAEITEPKVFSGSDSLEKLFEEIKKYNVKNPLVVTFEHALKFEKVENFLSKFESCSVFSSVKGEPKIKDVENAMTVFDENGCDSVIAIGGGTALDISKIIALSAANKGTDPDDMCRIYYKPKRCVPFFAVPTTSGTGSESTLYSVITDSEGKKKPYLSDRFQPYAVALCPELTLTVPKNSTVYTAVDALSHAVESYTSLFAPYFKEDVVNAPEACRLIFENLPAALENPENLEARTNLQIASFKAGISFRKAGTGYIHAVAHRLGEIYHIPHGEAIASCFVPILKATLPYNEKALSQLSIYCGFSDKKDSSKSSAEKFTDEIDKLIKNSGVDKSFEIKDEDIEKIIFRAQDEASLVGFPRAFSDKELEKIIMSL